MSWFNLNELETIKRMWMNLRFERSPKQSYNHFGTSFYERCLIFKVNV